jgi:nitronate monooxygenase
MTTGLQDLLGLRYPICQAPTGSIAGPELAAAVSDAGALGAMALTWATPEVAAEQVRLVRQATDAPFQVNYALYKPPVSLAAALAAGVPVVTFSWGDPAQYLAQVRAAGAKVGVQVANAVGARRASDLGADFLVCQGIEAGGHVQSTTLLEELLPRVLDAANGLPIIASGGIGDGAGIARVLSLGADGAMLGTRFVASRESRAHLAYKERLTQASAGETALTVCFDGDWPYATHRVLRNGTLEGWEASGCPPRGARPGEGEVVGRAASGELIRRAAPSSGTSPPPLIWFIASGKSANTQGE